MRGKETGWEEKQFHPLAHLLTREQREKEETGTMAGDKKIEEMRKKRRGRPARKEVTDENRWDKNGGEEKGMRQKKEKEQNRIDEK